jgi:hypothetical protein
MELAKEIVSRQHDKETDGDTRVLQVESKRKFKARTKGSSPDDSDSFFIGIELAKKRFGFKPSEKAAVVEDTPDGQQTTTWKRFVEKARRITKQRNFAKKR